MTRYLLIFLLLPTLIFAQKSKIKVKPFMTNVKVNDIEIDSHGNVVVGTNDLLFAISHIEVPMDLKKNIKIQSVDFAENGDTYAASTHTVYNIKKETEYKIPDPTAVISDIAIRHGLIYVGTNKGIFLYHLATKKWEQLTAENCNLKTDVISFIKADKKKDILWVGGQKGYYIMKQKSLVGFSEDHSPRTGYAMEDGFWIASNKALWKANGSYTDPIKPFDKIKTNNINAVAFDNKNIMYVASDYLYRYNPAIGIIEKYGAKDGINGGKIMHMNVDRDNNVWVGTQRGGLYKITFEDIVYKDLEAYIKTVQPIRCSGDANAAVEAIVTGGLPPYSYQWEKVATNNPIRKNIKAGDYEVIITDQRGKVVKSGYSIKNPSPLIVNEPIVKNAIGNKANGSISVQASGGNGTIKYLWSNKSEEKTAKNLRPGKYIVAVYDANKCIIKKQVVVKTEKPTLANMPLEKGQVIRLKNLTFKADSSAIVSSHYPTINGIVKMLNAHPKMKIEIGGHTNTIPREDYCNKLSSERAKNVANQIISKGIQRQRVTYKGYGKTQPKNRSRSVKARKINQRVEVKILSIE